MWFRLFEHDPILWYAHQVLNVSPTTKNKKKVLFGIGSIPLHIVVKENISKAAFTRNQIFILFIKNGTVQGGANP